MKVTRLTSVFAMALALAGIPAYASETGGAAYSPEEERAHSSELQRAEFRAFRATWYGPGFYGNRTACGQRLTRATLGVAHKRLRCGTRVAISYRGKTVVVPVIDRGPFARGIEYDLTYATAKRVGMTHTSRIRAATLRR